MISINNHINSIDLHLSPEPLDQVTDHPLIGSIRSIRTSGGIVRAITSIATGWGWDWFWNRDRGRYIYTAVIAI
jgi:hypothetical protein